MQGLNICAVRTHGNDANAKAMRKYTAVFIDVASAFSVYAGCT
jgi:hypothetical protein